MFWSNLSTSFCNMITFESLHVENSFLATLLWDTHRVHIWRSSGQGKGHGSKKAWICVSSAFDWKAISFRDILWIRLGCSLQHAHLANIFVLLANSCYFGEVCNWWRQETPRYTGIILLVYSVNSLSSVVCDSGSSLSPTVN